MALRQCYLSSTSQGSLGSLKLQLSGFAKMVLGDTGAIPLCVGDGGPGRIPGPVTTLLLISQLRCEMTLWLGVSWI